MAGPRSEKELGVLGGDRSWVFVGDKAQLEEGTGESFDTLTGGKCRG